MNINKLFCLVLCFSISPIFLCAATDSIYISSCSELRNLSKSQLSGKVLVLNEGTYNIDVPLTFHGDIHLFSYPNQIVNIRPIRKITNLIRSNGNLTLENIILDGLNKVQYGIIAYGNVHISRCVIQNLMGDRRMSGIGLRTNVSGKSIVVTNSVFQNISGFEDGIEGNSVGANRGLFLKGGDILIQSCTFVNIEGQEDTDAIHIQDADRPTYKSEITNCIFNNFGKRALKVTVSQNKIHSNKFYNTSKQCYVAIGLIGSSNNIITDNNFEVAAKLALVSFSNSSNHIVTNNNITFIANQNSNLFYIKNVNDLDLEHNVFQIKGNLNQLIRKGSNKNGRVNFSNSLNKILMIN